MPQVEDTKIKQFLSKYQNPDMTKRDILNVLNVYYGLTCKQDSFVFNDGSQKMLINLEGTVPVNYKGSVYNIPVSVWIMDTHPYNAPMCYVRPTADMHIKVSRYVDHNGKVYLPYLHDWAPNSSDLLGLVQIMIMIFGEQPPVYKKPSTGASQSTPYPTQPYMPVPTGSSSGGMSTPYPPYPPTSGYQPPTTSAYPPYPSYPSGNTNTNYPGYPSYPSSGAGYPYSNPGYPSFPFPAATQTTTQTNATVSTGTTGTITEEHIRLSLLSAVEDKLKRRLQEEYAQGQAELETLRRTQQELSQGKTRLDEILTRLDKEQVELDKNITILQDKEQELEKAIGLLSDQDPIDVDEAVTTTAPLYKQLLNAFAEEAATEDAIYYLGEALRRGVIDLDVFLKQVRTLSRKQFMLRALMQKCRQKAGLAG